MVEVATRARSAALAVMLALLLASAGCILPLRTEHHVGARNATDAPIEALLHVVDPATNATVAEHALQVPPGEGRNVVVELENGREYVLEARVGDAVGRERITFHSGSWWATAHYDGQRIVIATLHGD